VKVPRYVRASEVRAYCYCARGWWLQYVCGYEPQTTADLEAGHEAHGRHARTVLGARRLRWLAWWALVAAMALVLAGAVLLVRG
jgi:hypothetical protein